MVDKQILEIFEASWCPLSWVKWTWAFKPHMPAFDPERTWANASQNVCVLSATAPKVYHRKPHPICFKRATGVARWILWQGSQVWPRATDTINLSQFARKIFSAP